MIRYRYIPNPLDLQSAEETLVPHGPGVTVESLAPGDLENLTVWRNGRRVRVEEYGEQLAPNDSLDFVVTPRGLETLGLLFLAYAASTVAAALAPAPEPIDGNDQDSPTYGFGGIRSNPNSEGGTIPLVYGSHAVGGLEVAKFTEVTSLGETLYVLLLLSEGPVQSIAGYTSDQDGLNAINSDDLSGVRLNRLSAGNYDDVTLWIRLGTDEQEAIPGFTATVSQLGVEQTLAAPVEPGPSAAEIAPGSYSPTDPALEVWDTAATYDMDAEADGFRAILRLPSGLYSNGGSGLSSNSVQFQARYQELVGGVPSGNVVVLSKQNLAAATSSPFGTEYGADFADPSTYLPPTPGLLTNTSSSGSILVSSPSGLPSVPASQTRWSVAWWGEGFRDYNSYVVDNLASNLGFKLGVYSLAPAPVPGLGGLFSPAKVELILGDGSTSTDNGVTVGLITPWNWKTHTNTIRHWVVTYEYISADEGGRARLYVNGALKKAWDVGACQLQPDNDFDIYNVAASEGSTYSQDDNSRRLDDFRVYYTTLGAAEVSQLYNAGQGTYSTGSEPGLVLSLDFDTPGTVAIDKSPYGNDAILALSNAVGSGNTGVVPGASSSTPKRGTYRVELQRLNAVDTGDFTADQLDWEAIKLLTFEEFRYPGAALAALKIRATDQFNGGAPSIAVDVEGRPCPVWDQVDPVSPSFVPTFTRNPAWIALDALTSKEYGLGDYHSLATDIDVAAFQEWADYCDEFLNAGDADYLDAFDATSLRWTYSSGSVSMEFIGLAEPPLWEAGDFIRVYGGSGASSTWATTGAYDAIEITATEFDFATTTYTISGTWPSTASAPTTFTGAAPGAADVTTIKRQERRFQFDGVFDRPGRDGWEAVNSIFQTARSSPIRYGQRISVFTDKPRDPVALVGMGNVLEGSFSTTYSGTKDRPNAVTIEILDRDNLFDRSQVEREHPTLTDPSNEEFYRRRRIRREGVTRRSQALRECVYQLNVGHLIRRSCSFKLGADGLLLQPGDRIEVSHDVPGWGFSGRLRGAASPTSIQLDREVTIDGAKTYEVSLEDAGGGTLETRAITTGAGTYAAGTALTVGGGGFSFVPEAGDKYAFGETTAATYDFQVTDVKLDTDKLVRTVTANEYTEAVYSDEFGDLVPSPSALPVPDADEQIPASALEVSAQEDGAHATENPTTSQIDVAWQNAPETRFAVAENEIWLERISNGALTKVGSVAGTAESFQFQSPELTRGEGYTIFVRPRSRSGAAMPVRSSANAFVEISGMGNQIPAPGSFERLSAGDLATYVWTGLDLGDAREVHTRDGGWVYGQRLFESTRGADTFGPTAAWVAKDVTVAGFTDDTTTVARARSAAGSWSQPVISTSTFAPDGLRRAGGAHFDAVSWGTLGVLTVSGATLDVPSQTYGFNASSSRATFDISIVAGSVPRWLYISPAWECDQISPLTWDEATFAWGSMEGLTTTWEGSIASGGLNSGARPTLEIATTKDGTTPAAADLEEFSYGRRFFTNALLRVRFFRPDTSYDMELRKLGYTLWTTEDEVKRGTSFPADPTEGDRFYRTDLDAEFEYDATRAKWLGTALYEFTFFTINSINGAYFLFDDNGLNSSATIGYVAPYDVIAVGLSGVDLISTTATREIRDDGANVAQVSVSASSGPYSDQTLNSSTIAAGSVLSLYSTGLSAASHHIAYFRRVAT